MEKEWFWFIGGIILMFILSFTGIIFDKNDWIFLIVILCFVVLNIKLNKISRLIKKRGNE